ncbi:MAG: lytic transglycosylase domain-containing protein [Solirubrobacterales bacterium]
MQAATKPSRGPALLLGVPLALGVGLVALVISLALAFSGSGGCGTEAVGALSAQVPKKLVELYEGAAARYHLGERGPSVLAAINFVETDFGTNVATSSAGAEGWMAFLPSTFAEWGVDGNGDGVKDIFNAADAIYSAANYLHDSGAPGDWQQAVFAYNHADWYVEKVLRYARQFAVRGEVAVQTAGPTCAAAAVAPNEAVARMLAEAERLSALRPNTEYVWGGSHGESPTPANGPFDCSSAVSHLLQVGGFGNPTMATPELATWGEAGPGRWVTIFVKPYGGEAHTFLRFSAEVAPVSERYWGTSGFVEPGHGPGFIPESTFSAAYLPGFLQRHPPGL